MLFHARDLARRLDGELSGPDRTLDGVSIDSRSVAAGNLFVPLVAERVGASAFFAGFLAAATGFGMAVGSTFVITRGPARRSVMSPACLRTERWRERVGWRILNRG